jgi:hypothetical protein
MQRLIKINLKQAKFNVGAENVVCTDLSKKNEKHHVVR